MKFESLAQYFPKFLFFANFQSPKIFQEHYSSDTAVPNRWEITGVAGEELEIILKQRLSNRD